MLTQVKLGHSESRTALGLLSLILLTEQDLLQARNNIA